MAITGHKPFFTRPIEITTSNNFFYVTNAGVGNTDITLDTGVYAGVPAIMFAMEDACNDSAFVPTTVMQLSSDGARLKASITFSGGGGTQEIHFETTGATANPDLQAMLGAASQDYTAAKTYTFEYQPEYMWVPTYQNATQSRWSLDQASAFAGMRTKTGQLSGTETGPALHTIDLKFTNEPASNIFESGCTASHLTTKTLEYLIKNCRTSHPTEPDNPRTNGLFYFEDWDSWDELPGGEDGSTTTSEGIQYGLSSGADHYTYCSPDIRGYVSPSPSVPTGRGYYQVSLHLTRDTNMPTWQSPTQA
ncbi:MAG: hypothetical protein GY854_19895 [Deltaproteobacteria bacterium]|nr:hypothetical protein [Deltaproteobacteria bacterium]